MTNILDTETHRTEFTQKDIVYQVITTYIGRNISKGAQNIQEILSHRNKHGWLHLQNLTSTLTDIINITNLMHGKKITLVQRNI